MVCEHHMYPPPSQSLLIALSSSPLPLPCPQVLAPIFAADVDDEKGNTKAYYLSILLAKFCAGVASGTVLFHLHQCFSWNTLLGGAISKTSADPIALWWSGKGLLVLFSMITQSIPVAIIRAWFRGIRRAKVRQRQRGRQSPRRRRGIIDCCACDRYEAGPKLALFLLVAGSIMITIVLTSTGFLESHKSDAPAPGGAPCGCRGIVTDISGESDWLEVVLLVVIFRVIFVRPFLVLFATLLHLGVASCENESLTSVSERVLGEFSPNATTAGVELTGVGEAGTDNKDSDGIGTLVDFQIDNPMQQATLTRTGTADSWGASSQHSLWESRAGSVASLESHGELHGGINGEIGRDSGDDNGLRGGAAVAMDEEKVTEVREGETSSDGWGAEWQAHFDEGTSCWYHVHSTTGETQWAQATGETQWDQATVGAEGISVWEGEDVVAAATRTAEEEQEEKGGEGKRDDALAAGRDTDPNTLTPLKRSGRVVPHSSSRVLRQEEDLDGDGGSGEGSAEGGVVDTSSSGGGVNGHDYTYSCGGGEGDGAASATHPAAAAIEAENEWNTCFDEDTGRWYYVHGVTGETQWAEA